MYRDRIRETLARQGKAGIDPRWVEAWMRLEHGTLLVEVDDPAWATQVRFLHDELRTRLADVTGVQVTQIDVRVKRAGRR